MNELYFHFKLNSCSDRDKAVQVERMAVTMKNYVHYAIIIACLVATFFMYNEQLGAIPLLTLAAYLFYLGVKQVIYLKKNK